MNGIKHDAVVDSLELLGCKKDEEPRLCAGSLRLRWGWDPGSGRQLSARVSRTIELVALRMLPKFGGRESGSLK